MNKPKVITYSGVTINLAQVKCFRLSFFEDIGKDHTIIVEFKTRYDYIFNPATKEFEKQEYNESTEIEFPDGKTADSFLKDWESYWQQYLNEQEK